MEDLAMVAGEIKERKILIYGDSQLIIDFANRKSRPGLAHLFLKIRRV